MDKSIKELLDILKITYINMEIDITVTDPKRLYLIAKENGVSGSIYETIKNHIEDKEILSKFKKDFYLYVSDDTRKSEIQKNISMCLNSREIKHIFLKGSELKQMYPKSYMRSMGDIDVLLKPDEMDRAKEVLIENNYKLHGLGAVHDTVRYGKLDIELHRRLILVADYPEFNILESIWDSTTKEVEYEFRINPEMDLIYLLAHIKKHMVTVGVGLRNIIDIGIYLNYYKGKMDVRLLKELLTISSSLAFFESLLLINEKYLNLELKDYYKVDKELDEDLYEVFTEYIVRSGVHGLGMDFNTFTNRFAGADKAHSTKNKKLLRMVFPRYSSLKYIYPRLLKYNLLLPIAWIARWFKLFFIDKKRTNFKLSLLKKMNKEYVKEVNELFSRMGL